MDREKILSAMETCAGHGDTIQSRGSPQLRYHGGDIHMAEASRAKKTSQEGAVPFSSESPVPSSEVATRRASGWDDTVPGYSLPMTRC